VAVFTPLAFLQGTTGRLFNEFGIAVAGAVIVSGIVALTLTPMLSAKILRVPKSHGRVYQALERGFDGIASGYARALAGTLRYRWVTVGAAAAIVLLSVGVFRALEREFVPPEDRGFFPTFVVAPEGASLGYTDEYMRRVEAVLGSTEDIESYFAIVGFGGRVNGGIIFTRLTDWAERDRSVQELLGEVQPRLMQIPGIFAFANNPPAFGFGNPVQFVVRHPDFDSLSVAMDRFTMAARQITGLQNVDTDLRVTKPELTVNFERDRAEDLGVSVRDIAGTLQTMLGSSRVSTFTRDNKLYDVLVQLAPEARATPSDMTGLFVRGRGGDLVQLSAVARIEETVGPRQLNHFNRVRSFTLSAALAPGFTLGAALDSLTRVAGDVLPRGSSIELAGESRELTESGNALYFAFALALIVVPARQLSAQRLRASPAIP
jgi:multidrug efflux pump